MYGRSEQRPAYPQRARPPDDKPTRAKFERDGWRPIYGARWLRWRGSRPPSDVALLKGRLGEATNSFIVALPMGAKVDRQAPILGKPHQERPGWLWMDAPGFDHPILGCAADPRMFDDADLAAAALASRSALTLCVLARARSLDVERIPGRADYRTARGWYLAAARLGSWHAFRALAEFYERGLGVTPNPARADAYRRLSMRHGAAVAPK